MTIQDQDKALLIARGKRLRRLRALIGFTRDELAARANVSRASMSYWENATYSGLSHKAAEKVIPVIKSQGVYCSVEWLLLGVGQEPYRIGESAPDLISESEQQEAQTIQQEIALFTSLHSNAVVMQVPHNGMTPFFEAGDYIGGIAQPVTEFQELNPSGNYIVQVAHTSQVRRIKPTSHNDLYDLSYLNSVEGTNDLFELRGVRLETIASVIRVWR